MSGNVKKSVESWQVAKTIMRPFSVEQEQVESHGWQASQFGNDILMPRWTTTQVGFSPQNQVRHTFLLLRRLTGIGIASAFFSRASKRPSNRATTSSAASAFAARRQNVGQRIHLGLPCFRLTSNAAC